MAYHGYVPSLKRFLAEIKHAPAVLEVGVDKGVMFLTLATFLARTREQFTIVGIDVKLHEQTMIQLAFLDRSKTQQAFLVQDNSLVALPKLVEQQMKFDVVLIDGDHNYHTVSRELELLEQITTPECVVIIDDYSGRWAEKDLWYAERDGYEDVSVATKKVETEKHGVKVAVDEWVASHPGWQLSQPISGEPVVLTRT